MRKLRDFLDDYWTTGLERLRDVGREPLNEKRRYRWPSSSVTS